MKPAQRNGPQYRLRIKRAGCAWRTERLRTRDAQERRMLELTSQADVETVMAD